MVGERPLCKSEVFITIVARCEQCGARWRLRMRHWLGQGARDFNYDFKRPCPECYANREQGIFQFLGQVPQETPTGVEWPSAADLEEWKVEYDERLRPLRSQLKEKPVDPMAEAKKFLGL